MAYENYAGNLELNGRLITFWKKQGDWVVVENGGELLTFKAQSPLNAINRIVESLQQHPAEA